MAPKYKLAEVSGLSKQLLSFIVRSEGDVTDEVYRQIARGLIKEADRVRGSLRSWTSWRVGCSANWNRRSEHEDEKDQTERRHQLYHGRGLRCRRHVRRGGLSHVSVADGDDRRRRALSSPANEAPLIDFFVDDNGNVPNFDGKLEFLVNYSRKRLMLGGGRWFSAAG